MNKENEKNDIEVKIAIPLSDGDMLDMSFDDAKKLFEQLKKIFEPNNKKTVDEESILKKIKKTIEESQKDKDKFDPWKNPPVPYYPPVKPYEIPYEKNPWYPTSPIYPIITYQTSTGDRYTLNDGFMD